MKTAYAPESPNSIARLVLAILVGLFISPSGQAQTFNDVPFTYWAWSSVESLAASGITGGCGSGNYCPENPVTRAQMAVFLERGMNGSDFNPPAASGNVFLDVGANDFAASYIEQLFLDGVTGGCGGNQYCPGDNITRGQMAVFLLRAKYGASYNPPPAEGVFSDVPVGSFADSWIEQLAAEGITSGCGGTNFCPGDPVTRAQMAVFIARAFELPPPPPPPGPVNVNIDNPTLAVADNFDVSPGDTLTLVWSDEFDAAQLDPEVWFFENGDGSQYGIPGWGNNELQWYLEDSAELRDGMLVITAREQSVNGKNYTSARLNTRDRFAFKYGRIEARIRFPGGQGLWPAFWMLPQDDVYGTWAASGEIDIVEAVNLGGTGGNTVFGTIHYGGQFPANQSSSNDYLVPTNATTEFHTYAFEWDATEMRWYVDDILYSTKNSWFTTGAPFPAPFDERFYILFNVAVGGNFPGAPNATTQFPVEMEVDYVRVYSGEP